MIEEFVKLYDEIGSTPDEPTAERIARLTGWKANHIRELRSGRGKMRMGYIFCLRHLVEHPEIVEGS